MFKPLRRTLGAIGVVALSLLFLPQCANAAFGEAKAAAAFNAASWLGNQIGDQGYIATATGVGHPNYSSTAQAILALSAADADLEVAQNALQFLESHVSSYVTVTGAVAPGAAALLILDAESLGANPQTFGGDNLVTMLLSSEQLSGNNVGLFGTTTQVTNYEAGTYQQGFALAALAAVGDTTTGDLQRAKAWLQNQQCPNGGWTLPDTTLNPCTGLAQTYLGPDTNSTALSIEGLIAQGGLNTSARTKALSFFHNTMEPGGGWGYEALTPNATQVADPDSTAVVLQALIALGVTSATSSFVATGRTGKAVLLGFSLPTGAFTYPGATTTPNTIATYQAIPALEGIATPFHAATGSYWMFGRDGGVFSFGNAHYFGSLPALGVGVDDIVATLPTPSGAGYSMIGADGGVFSFGNAHYFGSLPALGVSVSNIVAAVASHDGGGYLLFGRDGGVFAFGDAPYFGSLPGVGVVTDDIVDAVSTPDGGGYWLVGADGGVFSFGDAAYFGSLPALGVNVSDIVGVAPSPSGEGYWLVGADGGVFAFGDASYFQSLPAMGVSVRTVVAITPSADGTGYYLASKVGDVYAFGAAQFAGSLGGKGVCDIVTLLVSPSRTQA